MKVRTTRERLLASTMIGGIALAAMAATPALAQDAGEPEATELEEIVVTGTRIPQANLVTTSPVTQVTSEDIDVAGVTRIEDLVTQLPQAFAAQNSTVANGASGTATVSLRGLGSDRTLVLIDGRRMGYGSPNDAAADLNQIPGQLVERVEVLTGGASAVYGSDAIAGVVNFIMRKDFEGVQIDAQYGFYRHENDYDGVGNLRAEIARRGEANPSQFQLPEDTVVDGESREVTLVMGVNAPDGKGNITAYAGYRKNNPVLQGFRDYSACALGPPAAGTPNTFTCGGSGTSFPGQFTDFGLNDNSTVGPDGIDGTADDTPDFNPLPSYVFTVDQGDGTFAPYSTALNAYNFGPTNYYQRPDERYTLGAFGRYEFNEHAEAFAQLMFSDYDSIAQIAPSGIFFNTPTINCDNPLLSAQQATAIGCGAAALAAFNTFQVFDPTLGAIDPGTGQPVGGFRLADPSEPGATRLLADPNRIPLYIGRRNVEGGGRQDSIEYMSYRMVVGLRGLITDGWNYDIAAQYSRVDLDRNYLNDFSVQRIGRALDVVDVNGTPTCRSVVDGTDAACVPYNPFAVGGITQEQLDYIQIPLIQTGQTTQQIVTAAVTGDLGQYGIQSPFASGGVQVAFGAEYRRDALESVTDAAFATGDGAGQGGPTIGFEGAIDTKDVFAEIQIPLAEGQAWADYASIDAAYRHSEYSTGLSTDTYKVGADYAPIQDIRLRGSYSRAVRAPNVIELFTAQGFNLFDMDFDPCGPQGEATLEQCLATGVPSAAFRGAALDSPAGQYNFLQGGNPDLEAEESDTYTVGVVFTPSFLPGLNASVDYFDISVDGLVSSFGALNTLAACYERNDQDACERINRGPSGSLWVGDGFVSDLNINIGGLETTGFDFNVNYGLDLADFGMDRAGQLVLNYSGTLLDEYVVDVGDGITIYDCVGFYGNQCGTPTPEYRHRARLTWVSPWAVDVSATWRHMGEAELFVLNGDGGARIDRYFDAENYLDLSAAWQVRDNVSLRIGVNNILDNDPPLSYSVGTTGNGNTYPQSYDALGQYWFFGLTADF
ncbi:TonB-dependent receptor domain-containing protein [Brevundimonas sp.]|uniref:TonB-dependent receptor domain-containing protein n=1 Tax=Brevundimonas sp. TaxID=1871086 RepID=UPI0035ADF16A